MGPPLRSFAADAHGCIMVRVIRPTEYKVAARYPRPWHGSARVVGARLTSPLAGGLGMLRVKARACARPLRG